MSLRPTHNGSEQSGNWWFSTAAKYLVALTWPGRGVGVALSSPIDIGIISFVSRLRYATSCTVAYCISAFISSFDTFSH